LIDLENAARATKHTYFASTEFRFPLKILRRGHVQVSNFDIQLAINFRYLFLNLD